MHPVTDDHVQLLSCRYRCHDPALPQPELSCCDLLEHCSNDPAHLVTVDGHVHQLLYRGMPAFLRLPEHSDCVHL